MRLEQSCHPAFARHETFHPRYGWVKKGVDASQNDTTAFVRDDAVIRLGVGKNMVKSIRHWGVAFRALSSEKRPGSRVPATAPSVLGEAMFGDRGLDPYCELPGTQWLLHWWLLAPGSIAPVWWLAFNEFPSVEFTEEELEDFVIDRTRDWAEPHPSAVKKDVSCLLRMYSSGQSARATFDDLVDCPFRDLQLVRPSTGDHAAYRFSLGSKPSLPSAIAAFACLDFIARSGNTSSIITVSRLCDEPGSPGRAFKLTESALRAKLEDAVGYTEGLEITSSAGVPQVAIDGDTREVATELLFDHYHHFDRSVRHPRGLLAGPDADRSPRQPEQLTLTEEVA